MIIRGKAASCPVSNSADFNLDLENALKINELDINQVFNTLLIMDKWARIAGEVFNCTSYDEFIEFKLNNVPFFGQNLLEINDGMIEILCKVKEDLINCQGSEYKAPLANSTLRKRSGMHGWGMAIDYDVGINPYVLNERSEEELDRDLN